MINKNIALNKFVDYLTQKDDIKVLNKTSLKVVKKDVNIFKLVPTKKQLEVIESKKRFRIVVAGRRSGKTTLARHIIVKKAMEKEESVNWWVSPYYRQAKREYKKTKHQIKKYNSGILQDKNDSELRLTLNNDSTIEFLGGDNEDSMTGEGIDYLVIDESGSIKDKTYYESLSPSLIDTNGEGLFIGTPKGYNFFYDLFMAGNKGEDESIGSFHFTTLDNHYIPDLINEINNIKRKIPENIFKQEIMAEFIADSSLVFANLHNVIVEYDTDKKGDVYYIGVDLAQKQDYTVIIVMNQDRQVISCERFNNTDWNYVKNRIANTNQLYKNCEILIDATSGYSVMYEDLKQMGLPIYPFSFTNTSKNEIVNKLIMDIDEKRVFIHPKFDILIDEMKNYSYTISKTGKFIYSSAYGKHDDCVMALALVNKITPFYTTTIPDNFRVIRKDFSIKDLF